MREMQICIDLQKKNINLRHRYKQDNFIKNEKIALEQNLR